MVDFGVIMGIDWLYKCYTILDCRAKVVKFEFPNESIREWKGNIAEPRVKFIAYLKAKKMITKGFLYHLVRVTDTTTEVARIQFVPIVNAFLDVFPDVLPGIPPDQVIDFEIDVVPDTQLISIPPYRMAPDELRELKEQLKILLDKGFIRPSASDKAAKFQWSDACERSFQELKARLTTAPVLTLPTGLGEFVIYCDASRVGLDCVLTQKAKDITACAITRSSVIERVKAKQFQDPNLVNIRNCVQSKDILAFSFDEDGLLKMNGCMYVLDIDEISNEIMAEAHRSRYSILPGSKQMYKDLREIYWWNRMKEIISDFVTRCLNFQQVKAEHQRPGGLAQNIEILLWKWEMINIDFVVGLPHTRLNHNSIWVIVDRLTKSAHFLPVKMTDTAPQYAKLYLKEIIRLHGILFSIISDRGAYLLLIFGSLSRMIGYKCQFEYHYSATDWRTG
ncbi:uncharacterized protein [Nicotiana tomentosiformis]|uniref:uncharacterized protein n=1 Tax=Nicotiana tomentosiformis TaxID=4098 RepID=UPI00388C72AB